MSFFEIVRNGVLSMLGISKRGFSEPRISHFFVLMLENRSYDNLLGYANLPGADGLHGVSIQNVDRTGNSANTSIGAPDRLSREERDPGHEFVDTMIQFCGLTAANADEGVNDELHQPYAGYPPFAPPARRGFLASATDHGSADPPLALKCFDPSDIPVLMQLANEFAVCDNWFSSMPGPTWPNRLFAVAGSAGGLDHSPSNWEILKLTAGKGLQFEHGTIFDRLGNDWLLAAGDAAVCWGLHGVPFLGSRNVSIAELLHRIGKGTLSESFVFIEPTYDAAFNFRYGDSMHPLGRVSAGERLIKNIYEAIRQSRYWEHSLLLFVFDEHGGFFDHATPPRTCPPPGDRILRPQNVKHGFQFDQYGLRVPAIAVSPWIAKGAVSKQRFDHGAIPSAVRRLLGRDFYMGERVAAANNVLELLQNTSRDDTPMTLADPALAQEQEQPEVPSEITPAMRAFFGPLHKARLRTVGAGERQALSARLDRITDEIEFEQFLRETFEYHWQAVPAAPA